MVPEVEGLHEAEKLVEKYLRSMTASEVKEEISYYRSTLSSSVPKMSGLSRAS
jgi:DNA-binding transcriptional regulator GbsR (MarR family)